MMAGKGKHSAGVKGALFEVARSIGLYRVSKHLQRSGGKLLILCYHGVSKADEHLWNPTLYISRSAFRQRLQALRNYDYQVLPLSAALQSLYNGTLTGRAAVVTFDDGWHDFYSEAWPELRSFNYPATVYQTTYYSFYPKPVFDTACAYLLWKGRGRTLQDSRITGTENAFTLGSPEAIDRAFKAVEARLRQSGASAEDKDRTLTILADRLNIDFGQAFRSRLLHLMNASEMAEVSNGGVDVQLHTHRHRLPPDKKMFLNEISANRELIEGATGKRAHHFCYPNGIYQPEFVPWLREAGVVSATTCDPGVASKESESLLLPRFTDSAAVSQARFESWLSGVGTLPSAWKRRAFSLSGQNPVAAGEGANAAADQQQTTGEVGSRIMVRAVGKNG